MRELVFAFLFTLICGFFGTVVIGGWLNWPDAGAVFAIAAMGCNIIYALKYEQLEEQPQQPDGEDAAKKE